MAKFWKIKVLGYFEMAHDLKSRFPQFKNTSIQEIEDNFRGSNVNFIRVENITTPFWIRITLPFALVFMLTLLILLPVKFMFTGIWAYRWKWTTNWFKALGF